VAGKELQIIIKAIDKASSVFDGVEKKATGLQKTLGVVGKVGGLAVAGLATAGAAAAGAITAIGVDATKTAISMESAFAGVIKTTDGLTSGFGVLNEAGTELKRAFKDLAETRPVAVEELMRIGELGGQLGIARENLIEFTGVIADIATATDLTADEAAMSMAQFMNVMGTAQEDVDRLGSTIVDLGNNFATTEPQILGFAERIAGAGAIAGLTESDVLGISTAMASVGVEAEAGGTAVQKVLLAMQVAAQGATTSVIDNSSEMAKSETKLAQMSEKLAIARQRLAEVTDKTAASTRMTREKAVRDLEQSIAQEQAALDTLAAAHGRTAQSVNQDLAIFAKTAGLTAAEFTALWEEDAGKAFELFVVGLGNQGDDALGTLEQLELQDQRLVRSFLSLSGAGDLVTRSMESANEAWEGNTALTEEAGQRYATTESQIALLRNVWRNLKGDIGDALLPAFRSVVELFQSLAQRYGPELVSFFETKVAPAIETVAGVLGQVVVGDWAGALETLFGGDRAQQILNVTDAIGEFAQNLKIMLFGGYRPIQIKDAMGEIIELDIMEWVPPLSWDQWKQVGSDWAVSLWTGLNDWIETNLLPKMAELMAKFRLWAADSDVQTKLEEFGSDLGKWLGEGLADFLGLGTTADEVGTEIQSMLERAVENIAMGVWDLGVALGRGLFRGIFEGLHGQTIEESYAGIAEEAREREPSGWEKFFKSYGEWYGNLPAWIRGSDQWAQPETYERDQPPWALRPMVEGGGQGAAYQGPQVVFEDGAIRIDAMGASVEEIVGATETKLLSALYAAGLR